VQGEESVGLYKAGGHSDPRVVGVKKWISVRADGNNGMEMSVSAYKSTRRHNPEDHDVNNCRVKISNLTSILTSQK
jgi:hypothetical protein